MSFARAKLIVIFLSALIVGYGLVGGLMDKVSARDEAYEDLSIFTEVLNKVRDEYVERPDIDEAMHGALLGMVESLDSYSSFVDRHVFQEFQEERGKMTSSPGIILSKRYGYAYVVSILPHSPAEEAGLRSGDLLESIDGRSTAKMSLWEAQQRLMGSPQSEVPVRLIRARRTQPQEVALARRETAVVSVSARIVDDQLGYLRIPGLESGVSEEVSAKIKMLHSSGVRGLMLDLRGAAVGSVEEAVKVASLFVPAGQKVISLRHREGGETEVRSAGGPVSVGVPVVVLVDSGTSGPAEVLAASLQDHQLATVVGERTDGKGSIQKQFHLQDGSVLVLSSQVIYRALGQPLQGPTLKDSGVRPDVRAPNEDFVSNFFFENTAEEDEGQLRDDFYRDLDQAVEEEQFQVGLQELRRLAVQKAA